jgi:protocatechuate 3,4-dioxygenase beta subunit
VLDPARQPVAAASVCAWASPGGGLVTPETRAPRCAKTDGAGAYALTDLFPATPLTLSAAAVSFAPTGYRAPNGDGELRLADGEQRTGVDFVLRGGGVPIKGSVNDATGGGVSGALVMSEDGPDRAVTMSDGKGAFTLWVDPGPTRVGATATGYAPGWASGPAPGHVFKIHLVPGATLVGRAVLAGGETPVAGVMIEGIQVEGGGARASTRTDEDGRFRVDGLLPGRYRVEATSEGREGYSRSSVTLGMGETSSEVLIELDPAYVVRGRVVDKATGEPCRGGQVTITDPKQNEYSQTIIEPDGWARMASVIPGTYKVEVSCKDHVDRDDYPTITIKDRDAPSLTWEVDRGAGVRVEIVDGQGRPVIKASVRAFATGPEGSLGSADHPEADGAFLVAGLKPGGYNVSVQATEGGRGSKEIELTLGREAHLKIELPPSGTIDGVVEDEAHRPVPYVQVVASGPSRASARSLDDGTFSLTGLPSGEYEVRASERSARRGAPGEDAARVVKVTVAAPARASVKVTVGGRDGVIEGRVTDSTDKPVTDAFIDFVLAAGGAGVPRYGRSGRAPIITDPDGRFTVDGLAEGEYNLRAYRKGGGEATAEGVKVGTHDLALKLGEGGSISGTLTARNAPVERFTLSVRQTKTSFSRGELFFHAGGVFALHDLPAGTYEVEAETPEGTTTTTVTLAEGEQKSGVALTLTMRGEVDGRLVDLERGAPLAGMRLNVEGSSSATLMNGDDRNNKSGADGRFHLEGVLAGHWSLTVSSEDPDFESVSVPIEVGEGGGATDVGAIRLPRRRVAPGEPRGDLGLVLHEGADAAGEVTMASGAAEEAGIRVGDVIVSVDGFDVQRANRYLLSPLTTVGVGRAVKLGLGRGATVSVVARGVGAAPSSEGQ